MTKLINEISTFVVPPISHIMLYVSLPGLQSTFKKTAKLAAITSPSISTPDRAKTPSSETPKMAAIGKKRREIFLTSLLTREKHSSSK